MSGQSQKSRVVDTMVTIGKVEEKAAKFVEHMSVLEKKGSLDQVGQQRLDLARKILEETREIRHSAKQLYVASKSYEEMNKEMDSSLSKVKYYAQMAFAILPGVTQEDVKTIDEAKRSAATKLNTAIENHLENFNKLANDLNRMTDSLINIEKDPETHLKNFDSSAKSYQTNLISLFNNFDRMNDCYEELKETVALSKEASKVVEGFMLNAGLCAFSSALVVPSALAKVKMIPQVANFYKVASGSKLVVGNLAVKGFVSGASSLAQIPIQNDDITLGAAVENVLGNENEQQKKKKKV